MILRSTIPPRLLVAVLAGLMLASACGGRDNPTAQSDPTPVATPVAAPVDTPVVTPVDTPVVTPVDTPVVTPVDTPVVTPVDTPVATPVDTPVVTPVDTPVVTPPEANPAPQGGMSVDLEALFPPPDEMREMVLNNCTNCHTFVPILILQMSGEHWTTSMNTHREYVALGEEERQILYDYLIANFNPDTPVPELPAPLLEAWTSY
jgi:hypothetical protein